MGYAEDSLIPVMQHIAKNVIKLNEGHSKHLVSGVWVKSYLFVSVSICSKTIMSVLVGG